MIDPDSDLPLDGLPPELAALDAELLSLRMEERPSFGPELEAELAREWARPTPAPSAFDGRRLAAAACLALLFVAVGVPPARASLVALIGRIQVVGGPAAEPAAADPARSEVPADPEVAEARAPEAPATPPAALPPAEVMPFRPARVTFPKVLDGRAQERVIRRFYPRHLQEQRIGGTVNLLVWLDSAGTVTDARLQPPGSGVPELDDAALEAAPLLRFTPATREGRPVGTWVEFDIVFAPRPEDLPSVRPVDRPELAEARAVPPEWTGHALVPAPTLQEARQLLAAALENEEELERLGSLDRLIEGEPAPGTDPMAWRGDATLALERGIVHAPDNPAPFLALARIRRKQGLRAEARTLLERGIQRAQRGGGTISPRLTAQLHYELATVVRESWRAEEYLGRLPSNALAADACPRAGRVAPAAAVPAERLIAWNYLCPEALGRALQSAFVMEGDVAERAAMRGALEAAVAADPGHVGANVELLLDRAETADWWGLLNGARRFAWASQGHPFASLLSGLALQRLGRSEEALADLETALAGLSPEEAARVRDLRPLLEPAEARRLGSLSAAKRAAAEADFWAPLDPVASTAVNERQVEHLARAAFAHLRLGGSATGAGEVWVRYGAPSAIRAVAEGAGLRTELWDYGAGPDITFRRPAAAAAGDLTPEGRAYVDDLRSTLPHAYGTQARTVVQLAAQIARFRDAAGAVEVEVQARVPDALVAAGDSLDIALVQLGARGAAIHVQRERIPAGPVTVPLRAGVRAEARTLVVEVYSSSLERVAAARMAATRDVEGADAGISDLQLTAPVARAERAVERGAPWVLPLADAVVEGAEVGVLFELYDLPRDGGYRLRVELDGGAREPRLLGFRPAGGDADERLQRAPWPGAGRSRDYLVASLEGIAPGRYTLRVVAELADGRERVAERVIERR